MATLKFDTRQRLYRILDALEEECQGKLEVRTIAGQSPEMVVGPTELFEELCDLGELPGLFRTSLRGDSFGGWKATYTVVPTDLFLALREYRPHNLRVEAAVKYLSSARMSNPRLYLSGSCNSSLWVTRFDSSEEAQKFSEALERLAFISQSMGNAVRIDSPELEKLLLEADTPTQDDVNHPSHYASESGLEAIEVIEAFFHENAFLANTFKYIARAGKKGGEVKRLEDLRKAQWYLEREIKLEEAREDR